MKSNTMPEGGRSGATCGNCNIIGLQDAIRVNQQQLREYVGDATRLILEQMLNGLLAAEATWICSGGLDNGASDRRDRRVGHRKHRLVTKTGEVTLRIPRLQRLPFESDTIARYRRCAESVEGALAEMFLTGLSLQHVQDITESLWGARVNSPAVSRLASKVHNYIRAWRSRQIVGEYAHLYLDGLVFRRSWAGEKRNVPVLVAVGIISNGRREILGVAEGAKQDPEDWHRFLQHMSARGLASPKIIVSDACCGLVEGAARLFPRSEWRRSIVDIHRTALRGITSGTIASVARSLSGGGRRSARR